MPRGPRGMRPALPRVGTAHPVDTSGMTAPACCGAVLRRRLGAPGGRGIAPSPTTGAGLRSAPARRISSVRQCSAKTGPGPSTDAQTPPLGADALQFGATVDAARAAPKPTHRCLGWYGRCAMLRDVRSTRILSSLFYVGLDALGIPRAARLSRRAGTILCYHNVMPEGAAGTATPDLHMHLAHFE